MGLLSALGRGARRALAPAGAGAGVGAGVGAMSNPEDPMAGALGGAAMGALGGAGLGMAGGGMGRMLQRAAGQEPESIGALMFRKQNLERLRQQVAQRAQQSPLYSEDRQMLNSIEAQLREVDEDIAALGGP